MLPSPDSRPFLSSKLFLGKLLPKPKSYSKFELANFNDCKNKYGSPKFFGMLPLPGPLPFVVLKVVSWQTTSQVQVVYQI